jgi:AraC-like DNA-binding protein
VTYHERPSVVPGVVVWQRGARPGPSLARILPDGCMDLIWDGDRLFVAGPDTRARWHPSAPGTSYVGLRFTRGLGPGLLGVPAHKLRDATPPLRDLWPDADARALHEQVAGQPAAALEQWLERRAESWERPSLGPAVFDLAAGGLPVVAMAERLGYGPRQLHRRCLPLFGYGPQHLARVLRLSRALAAARAGEPLGRVAATAGFADQAHLTREVRDLAGTTPVRLLSESAG